MQQQVEQCIFEHVGLAEQGDARLVCPLGAAKPQKAVDTELARQSSQKGELLSKLQVPPARPHPALPVTRPCLQLCSRPP